MNNNSISIIVTDDHKLFRKGLIGLIQQLSPDFKILTEASNGKDLLSIMETGLRPDLVLLDINMPIMNGHVTMQAMQEKFPETNCLVLTMQDDDITLIRLLKAGAKGFINKDVESEELERAIFSVVEKGFYYSDFVSEKLVGTLRAPIDIDPLSSLNEQDLRFIELACSEFTYKEIADIMNLSIKTVDGYRGKLFEKLELKSRVGLVLFALKNKIISL